MSSIFDDIDGGKYGGRKKREPEAKPSFFDRIKSGASKQGDKIKANIKEKIKYNQDVRKASKEAYKTEYKRAKVLQAKREARSKAKGGFLKGRNLDLNKYERGKGPGLSVESQAGGGLYGLVTGTGASKLGTRKRQKKEDEFNFI